MLTSRLRLTTWPHLQEHLSVFHCQLGDLDRPAFVRQGGEGDSFQTVYPRTPAFIIPRTPMGVLYKYALF